MEHDIAETPASRGDLRATPFAQVLIELFEAAETGTLYLHDPDGMQLAAIRIEAGLPVRARIAEAESGGHLLQALVPLCSNTDGSFAFSAGEDGIHVDGDVIMGRVDPRALLAAAARGPLREDAVSEVMVAIGRNLLMLNPRADLARYAFSAEERKLIDALSDEPIDYGELAARTEAPDHALRRFMYLLRVTHALTILPAARRTQSGTVAHVEPPGAPTRANAARPGSYSVVAPEHGTVALLDGEAGVDIVIDVVGEDPPAPAREHPKRSAAAQAQSHQARAEALLEQRDYAEALREASAALKLGSGNAECQALYAWALYQHNGGGERVHPRVWDHLEHAIKRDPLCERAHLYKARLLKRLNRLDAANWHFRRVLQIQHDNLEAAREVRLYGMRKRHLQPSGLVRRLLDRLK